MNPPRPAINPVRLCCGQQHSGAVCPDGLVMCGICFARFPADQLAVDHDGDRWDVCTGCAPQAGIRLCSPGSPRRRPRSPGRCTDS